MTTEKWIAGASAGWQAAFGAEIDSLPDGQSVLSSIDITNDSAKDMFCDVSFKFASISPTGTPYASLYLIPLIGDGATYGDGRFGSQAAGQPPQNNFVGYAGLQAGTGVRSGDFQLPGRRSPLIIPIGIFRFCLNVHLGAAVALAASGNHVYYRTFNKASS